MGFKLGKNRGLEVTGGEIKTKMRFGKQAGEDGSVPGTPVIRVPLDEGIMGEANMDGTIYVNKNIVPGSQEDKQVINYCGGGIAATLNAFVLRQLGIEDLEIYDNSMSEWAMDSKLPIETDI